MKIYELHQDVSGRWFGYCEETKEYTPSFIKCKNLKKNAYLERLGVEMIELRDCIVGVKVEKEYEKVIQIAKEQGCEWNSGDSLDYIYCTFPTRLFFDKRGRVTFGGYHEKYCDYHCKNLMSRLRELIIIRQKGKL